MSIDSEHTQDYIFQLPLPVRPKPVVRDIGIFPGHCYHIVLPEAATTELGNLEHDLQNGLIGTYRLDSTATEMKAVDINAQPLRGFVWDAELLSPCLKQSLQIAPDQPHASETNRLTLIDIAMEAPEVRLIQDLPALTIAPRLELEWRTGAYASQLGIVQLVESTRTVFLANGEPINLVDTEAAGTGPVLYLTDATDNATVKPVCRFQAKGEQQRFEFSSAVTQIIPAELDDKAITSISVLEKYTLYFMQNANPEDPEHYIWAPVHLPIVWGWSIRVQQRYDGFWDIFRKKLMLPTPSTEAPALPHWQNNSLRCCSKLEI